MNSSIPFKESKSNKKQVVALPNNIEIFDSRKRPFDNSVLLGVMGKGVARHPKNKKHVL